MNTQSTSATMPLIVIPTAVNHLGPQLSRLPDEILHQIFKTLVTTMFPPTSRFNNFISPQIFTILNHHYAINRIRNVSPTFTAFFMEAFYENFTFAFKHRAVLNLETDHLTSFPAPVPAPHLRHHLRSIRIDIALETYYFTPQRIPNFARPCRLGRSMRQIVTTTQMLAFCPSARFLLLLTNEEYGFGRLRFLHLHVRVDDRVFKVGEDFLRVVEEMHFVVKAARVEVVVTDGGGFVGAEYEEVKKRIVVVE